ncbi:MAG: hypothetical protein PHP50_09445 [Lachnospiraceae bacterium]|nr:hypothetical protein [Lachnospiraceae bacterium]
MNRKVLGYIGVIIIGVGFILMAAANTLHSEIVSVLQAVLGVVFIVAAIKKIWSDFACQIEGYI